MPQPPVSCPVSLGALMLGPVWAGHGPRSATGGGNIPSADQETTAHVCIGHYPDIEAVRPAFSPAISMIPNIAIPSAAAEYDVCRRMNLPQSKKGLRPMARTQPLFVTDACPVDRSTAEVADPRNAGRNSRLCRRDYGVGLPDISARSLPTRSGPRRSPRRLNCRNTTWRAVSDGSRGCTSVPRYRAVPDRR